MPRSALAKRLLGALTLAVACRSAGPPPTVDIAPAPLPTPSVAAPAPTTGAFDPAGRWNLVFDIQGQNLEVVMELVKAPDGSYGGSLSSQMGVAPITKATLDGKKMSVTFDAPGGGAGSMTLLFDGRTVTGDWSASGMGSTVSGSRP